ncbi:MAG: methyltransferase domain-containing protein [Pelatocladus maniniholoensis HA4357-MV3]|jgi:SAM-dependent methyltransferase/archaellum component FlaC|uniref:Methyltransferase domain-containing protein n=1 Tax=Pelatocladus maniniholoensis HA4357-MV3 TaxID=1117104 RepID=A0A9E3HCK0_9NOST|nr:methyltransferase domain-containing protein [Pelatocladus maniniholoensis HA4357-MV3]BAZ67919.1 putative methyltransferase [Fischerella sp. NIES-4106]
MSEANNPEIDVDELMRKIREEVAKLKKDSKIELVSTPKPFSSIKINNHNTSAMNANINHMEGLLKNAESRAISRTKWPDNLNRFPFNFSKGIQKLALKILNFIFKDQREVNFNVIKTLKESVALNRQSIAQIETLRSQLNECLNIVNTSLEKIDERFDIIDINLQKLDERLCTADTSILRFDERLSLVNSSIQKVDNNFNKIDTQTNTSITTIQEHLDTVNSRIEDIDKHLSSVDALVHALDERSIRNESYLKNDLIQQKRLITLFLEEAWQRLPEPFNQQQLQTFVQEEQHSLDAFYASFEDNFRGSFEDIFNRLKPYLPLIEQAKIGTPDSPILDVGCGRGEWLELLRESGYIARGLDINRVMIERCQTRGLEVIEADAIAHLLSLPDSCLGAVTGFHIIEHLPFPVLMKFVSEVVRILKPGGLAIFETPNPQNVLVGSCNFYFDPTHRHPLPSSLVKFIFEIHGFFQVKIINLHPFPDNYKVGDSDLAERFNDYFYGPQDYAVVGYKPL